MSKTFLGNSKGFLPRCQGDFQQKVEAFYEKISKLPKEAKAEAKP
jgi:hypothetical protein